MTDPRRPSAPTQNAPNEVPLTRTLTKDQSLMTLVPKRSGGETAPPINEFFEAIEGVAAMGHWTETDQKQMCALKLTDAARAFYSATPELREPAITWQQFKERFLQRFKDVRTAQYHLGQLYMARQRKGETAQEFLDRCRILAKRTVPCSTNPVLQQAYNEQAEQILLSAFSKGLLDTPGRQVRYASPATAEEALRIAVTVSQAEIHEARDSAFYLDTEVTDITPAGRAREPAVQHATTRQSVGSAGKSRKQSTAGQRHSGASATTSSGQSNKQVRCYDCSGYGHIARDCANRRQTQAASNANPDVRSRSGQAKVNEPPPRARQNPAHERRATKQALN
jgi:hypothetical protein